MEAQTVVRDHEQYSIALSEDRQTLVFNWGHVAGLSAEDFGAGIVEFANQCRLHKPVRALIEPFALTGP